MFEVTTFIYSLNQYSVHHSSILVSVLQLKNSCKMKWFTYCFLSILCCFSELNSCFGLRCPILAPQAVLELGLPQEPTTCFDDDGRLKRTGNLNVLPKFDFQISDHFLNQYLIRD